MVKLKLANMGPSQERIFDFLFLFFCRTQRLGQSEYSEDDNNEELLKISSSALKYYYHIMYLIILGISRGGG